jgi:hypothetical protein
VCHKAKGVSFTESWSGAPLQREYLSAIILLPISVYGLPQTEPHAAEGDLVLGNKLNITYK